MSNFSVKQYLLDNNLANEDGDLIPNDNIPDNPDWGLGPYNQWAATIHLCTLIHFFEQQGMLDNLRFFIKESDSYTYRIYIDQIDKNDPSTYQWNIIVDVLEYLIPYMAGSNVSYLAGQLFFDL